MSPLIEFPRLAYLTPNQAHECKGPMLKKLRPTKRKVTGILQNRLVYKMV